MDEIVLNEDVYNDLNSDNEVIQIPRKVCIFQIIFQPHLIYNM